LGLEENNFGKKENKRQDRAEKRGVGGGASGKASCSKMHPGRALLKGKQRVGILVCAVELARRLPWRLKACLFLPSLVPGVKIEKQVSL